MIYSPGALPEENKSYNHELKADKRLIFTVGRIPQGMKNTLTKNASIVHLFLVFEHSMLALVAFKSFSAF